MKVDVMLMAIAAVSVTCGPLDPRDSDTQLTDSEESVASGLAVTPSARLSLTGNLNMYISPTGIDTGNCADPAKPCATPTYAYSYAQQKYDLMGKYLIFVRFKGNYTLSSGWTFDGPLTGQKNAGAFIFDGASPVTTTVRASGANVNLFFAKNGASFTIQNMTLTTSGSGSTDILASDGVIFGNNLWFGATGNAFVHMVGPRATFTLTGPVTFLHGSDPNIAFVAEDHAIINLPSSLVVSGAPRWRTAFVQADLGGMIDATNARVTPASASGRRFNAISLGIVFTGGTGNANFFPGSTPGYAGGGFYQ